MQATARTNRITVGAALARIVALASFVSLPSPYPKTWDEMTAPWDSYGMAWEILT